MITNFEDITHELSEEEMKIIPILLRGFKSHTEKEPIKAPEIVKAMNHHISYMELNFKMTDARLRKCVNYIRCKGLLPLIATSNGYYVSYDREVIESQIRSLTERANSIRRCADGMQKFLKT